MTNRVQEPPTLTVSQLTKAIKIHLESAFSAVFVKGEVWGAKLHSSGHFYFTLKDEDSQITCVLFRQQRAGASLPKEGDSILVYGELNVYPKGGRYQIICRSIKKTGIGELLALLEERKKLFHKRGWFSSDHKKPLPFLPKRVGVITSPTGAVIRDIIHVISRRFPGASLLLNPVSVQGEGASKEIALAIEQMNTHKLADVLIVGRGGGSLEDLWAFNEENVCRAIFLSTIPIICAVGHETDHTLAEYVADQRASTPSAAAELVLPEKRLLQNTLSKTALDAVKLLRYKWRYLKKSLEHVRTAPIFTNPMRIIQDREQNLDEMRANFSHSLQQKVFQEKLRLSTLTGKIEQRNPKNHLYFHQKQLQEKKERLCIAIRHFQKKKRKELNHIHTLLKSIHPNKLLQKGYTILFSEKDHSIIKSVDHVQIGDIISATLKDGHLKTKVCKKNLL